MEKVLVQFSHEANHSFTDLRNGPPLVSQLAINFYNELFDIPPEKWGKMRKENNSDTFVSENHCIFDIRGVIEDTTPTRTLYVTHFELRKKTQK